MDKNNRLTLALIGFVIFLASIACQSLFPKTIKPGSVQEEVAKGNIRFDGSGNLSYGECQDPTAAVRVSIGSPVKEYEGQEFYDPVNPVTVNALTDGAIPWSGTCEKFNLDDKHDWPAKGLYYPKEEKILFFSCAQVNGKAGGEAHLVGEGFEGEYACYHEDGSLSYNMAFSAYSMVK